MMNANKVKKDWFSKKLQNYTKDLSSSIQYFNQYQGACSLKIGSKAQYIFTVSRRKMEDFDHILVKNDQLRWEMIIFEIKIVIYRLKMVNFDRKQMTRTVKNWHFRLQTGWSTKKLSDKIEIETDFCDFSHTFKIFLRSAWYFWSAYKTRN